MTFLLAHQYQRLMPKLLLHTLMMSKRSLEDFMVVLLQPVKNLLKVCPLAFQERN